MIKELKIYGTKNGWNCEDSSSVNVAELTRDFSPWEWGILGDRENDYCRYNSRTIYRDSDTLIIDREYDAQGNDIMRKGTASGEWQDIKYLEYASRLSDYK